ncbi:5627_t:CDS:2 [Entrophospora sp. SA101]|nr:5627_t:CDS:2 [Entrophospora sp. SA101]
MSNEAQQKKGSNQQNSAGFMYMINPLNQSIILRHFSVLDNKKPLHPKAETLYAYPTPLNELVFVLRLLEPEDHRMLYVIDPCNIEQKQKSIILTSARKNTGQVRYSFISTDGGEMIDISDTIEDILGDVDVLVVEEEKEYCSRCRYFGKDC